MSRRRAEVDRPDTSWPVLLGGLSMSRLDHAEPVEPPARPEILEDRAGFRERTSSLLMPALRGEPLSVLGQGDPEVVAHPDRPEAGDGFLESCLDAHVPASSRIALGTD